ncbi:SiaC family regulatory phosphoprotein [Ekhidna sp. To15]|uniref:SiaC family regulatory phosphoprotein n=1 Tax=Ekhidna sp. To15 TaxID=3395267 RepID=UPI003F51B8CE
MDYFRKGSDILPAVIMDSGSKSALIKGVSLCEDLKICKQMAMDIKQNIERTPYTDLNIQLSVFNTKAARLLFDVFRAVKKYRPSLNIHWLYDQTDVEMKEMGMDYSELLEMDFDISPN